MTRSGFSVNLERLDEVLRYKPGDEGIFLQRFHYRAVDLLAELKAGQLPREIVALECIMSALSYFEHGKSHDDIKGAYPVRAWRENTVTVPAAWLRVIAEGWAKYRKAPSGRTFGEVMNLEGNGQGARPAKAALGSLNRRIRLANLVATELLYEKINGDISEAKAIGRVAEAESLSFETVKKAWQMMKRDLIKRLAASGIAADGVKTSRSR